MEYIDIETWKRKEHFNFFYRMDYPQYNICLNIDVSRFLQFTKANRLSFYYSITHAVTTAANSIEELKYRIRDGKVVLRSQVHPSFTEMGSGPDNDLFKLVTVDYDDDIFVFEKNAKETSMNQTDFFDLAKLAGRDDLLYITCLPWISFTHLSHTISLNRNDSVPRISWGKYFRQGSQVLLPFSVQVHHALADGYHVGKFIEKLQEILDRVSEKQPGNPQ